MTGNVTDIAEARRRRLTPTSRALLAHTELASYPYPYGPEPPSEELLGEMLALPTPDRLELAEILGSKALETGNGHGSAGGGTSGAAHAGGLLGLQLSRCAVCGWACAGKGAIEQKPRRGGA